MQVREKTSFHVYQHAGRRCRRPNMNGINLHRVLQKNPPSSLDDLLFAAPQKREPFTGRSEFQTRQMLLILEETTRPSPAR